MDVIKKRLAHGFSVAFALLFLLQSRLWDKARGWLQSLLRRVGGDACETKFADFLHRLSPEVTLAVFAIPAFIALPYAFDGVGMIADGRLLLGSATIFIANTLALGAMALVFRAFRRPAAGNGGLCAIL